MDEGWVRNGPLDIYIYVYMQYMYIRWEVQATSAPVFLLRRTKLAVWTYKPNKKNTKTFAGKRGKTLEDVFSRIFQTNAENN